MIGGWCVGYCMFYCCSRMQNAAAAAAAVTLIICENTHIRQIRYVECRWRIITTYCTSTCIRKCMLYLYTGRYKKYAKYNI